MILKERLEAVWQAKGIACPNNLARWNESRSGYSRFSEFGLWFTKGKLIRPKQKKVKGKGWTWICKNYGLYANMLQRNIK